MLNGFDWTSEYLNNVKQKDHNGNNSRLCVSFIIILMDVLYTCQDLCGYATCISFFGGEGV